MEEEEEEEEEGCVGAVRLEGVVLGDAAAEEEEEEEEEGEGTMSDWGLAAVDASVTRRE